LSIISYLVSFEYCENYLLIGHELHLRLSITDHLLVGQLGRNRVLSDLYNLFKSLKYRFMQYLHFFLHSCISFAFFYNFLAWPNNLQIESLHTPSTWLELFWLSHNASSQVLHDKLNTGCKGGYIPYPHQETYITTYQLFWHCTMHINIYKSNFLMHYINTERPCFTHLQTLRRELKICAAEYFWCHDLGLILSMMNE